MTTTTVDDSLIQSFVFYLRVERQHGENTVTNYESDVRNFAEWLAKPLPEADRADLLRYFSHELNAGVNPSTLARRRFALQKLFCFLMDEGHIKRDPTRHLPMPKRWKRMPKVVSTADFDKMIDSLGPSPLEIRDKAMLLTFFASGLRESELQNLKLEDLNLDNIDSGSAKVWEGKGDKDGTVPLSPPAISALRVYLDTVRPRFENGLKSPYVFLGRRGERLTRMQIYNRVADIAEASIGRRISPHVLRHGYATALMEGGADIRDVQCLMRHSDLDTTAIYVHINLEYLRRNYYASHPRARIAAV